MNLWWYELKVGSYICKLGRFYKKFICWIRGFHKEGEPRIQYPTFGQVGKTFEEEVTRENGKIVHFIYCLDCGYLIRKEQMDSITLGDGTVVR
jgi:hypothetical protein